MVKDATGRFPDNELWGDGWGWALFNGDDRNKQVAVNYRTECRSCHVPVRKTDWVYYQCYPELTKALESRASGAPSGDAPEKAKPSDKDTSNVEQKPKPDLAAMFPQWKEAQTLKGDHLAGDQYFASKKVNNSMTCMACHSFNPKDTMEQDGDGLMRAGFPVYASVHRTNIKNSGTNLAALGGNICVLHFMGGEKPGMSAQELANMDAFLKTGGDKDHPTAKNVDYSKATWTVPQDLSGGDATRGGELALKTCITCHDVDKQKHRIIKGGLPLHGHSFGDDDLEELALQIRNPNYEHNGDMPGYTDLRLNNQQLLDLIAWFRK
jgi:mono/diheme cytochrome c family protein